MKPIIVLGSISVLALVAACTEVPTTTTASATDGASFYTNDERGNFSLFDRESNSDQRASTPSRPSNPPPRDDDDDDDPPPPPPPDDDDDPPPPPPPDDDDDPPPPPPPPPDDDDPPVWGEG